MSRYHPRGKTNRALLVGVSEYDYTTDEREDGVSGQLPSVRHNRNKLKDALHRSGTFGEGQIVVCPSPSHDAFDEALRHAAEEAEGLLLFYFAGHGIVSSSGAELFLQMRNARVSKGGRDVFPNATSLTHLVAELAGSRAERVVVILDCCFAGNAAGIWQNFDGSAKQKILLLMSVQSNRLIDAGDGTRATPFTEELVQVLDASGRLWLTGLYSQLKDRMARARYEAGFGDVQEPQAAWVPGEDVLLCAVNGDGHENTEGSEGGSEPAGVGEARSRSAEGGEDRSRSAGGGEDRSRSAGGGDGGPESAEGGEDRPESAEEPLPPARQRALRHLVHHLNIRSEDVAAWVRRHLRTVVVLSLALCTAGVSGYVIADLATGHGPCSPPLELRVMTDPELQPTVRAAADAYLTSDANTADGGCRRTGITVYSAGATDAVTALSEQTDAWQEPREDVDPQRDVGPQPDIWIPATGADVARVTAGQEARVYAELDPDKQPFAYSPIVLAVPKGLAGTDGESTGRKLVELIEDLRKRNDKAEVRRTDPEYTDTALLATIALYDDASGDARAGEQLLTEAGPPSPTSAELLCTLPDDDAVDNRAAAVVPEFLMKSGVGCDPATRAERTAEYPDDVPALEPTFVRVSWKDADRDAVARQDGVDRFRTWLTGEGGQKEFGEDGFRSASDEHRLLAAPPVHGVLRDPGRPLGPAVRTKMDTTLEKYRGANGPGRVLFLLDSSGSMDRVWDGASGGPGLLKQSLGGLGTGDEYGVWSVYGLAGSGHTDLMSFGHHRSVDAEGVLDDGNRTRVRDDESDPRAALVAALRDMAGRGKDDDWPRLIVYLTDDEDNNRLKGGNLTKVLGEAHRAGVPVDMVSLTSGGCDRGRPDALISEASGGRCLDAGDDLGPDLHDEVARTGTGED